MSIGQIGLDDVIDLSRVVDRVTRYHNLLGNPRQARGIWEIRCLVINALTFKNIRHQSGLHVNLKDFRPGGTGNTFASIFYTICAAQWTTIRTALSILFTLVSPLIVKVSNPEAEGPVGLNHVITVGQDGKIKGRRRNVFYRVLALKLRV